MKTNNNLNRELRMPQFLKNLTIKSVLLGSLVLAGIQMPLQAQDTSYTKPSWWFGVAAGANINYYHGSTRELNSTFTSPVTFHDGFGNGLYAAPLIEYYNPDSSKWGLMLQVGYDNRQGSFNKETTPCNCPADLSTDLTYISVEPSLRFAPFNNNLYFYGGPRIGFLFAKSFTYSQKANPDIPGQVDQPDVKSDFSKMNDLILSMQIGAGIDIPLITQEKKTQFTFSPFISFQPYFGQSPRSIETWNLTTLRLGASVKFGRGTSIAGGDLYKVTNTDVRFSVYSPTNITGSRRVREIFPLRNYIFFDLESTEIPNRYEILTKDQVKDFKEDQLEVFTPKTLKGRSERQMTAYYNVLNIIGDRMGKNPSTSIVLTGSSEKGPEDGKLMAESVKKYLVDIFDIGASRIRTEGSFKPKIPSEKEGATRELDLLREGDRRVSIESSSAVLLNEFQSGNDALMRSVEFNTVQDAPLDSYVTFNVDGATNAFKSWSLEIKDEKGTVQNFGSFSRDQVSIPGKSILGIRPSGDYKVAMIGTTNDKNIVRKETSVHMNLWTPSEREEGRRYSVLFEINDSKSIQIYEKYLSETVSLFIPKDGKVIIHGHTDIIGSDASNLRLSLARANDVKGILANALSKAGRKDVTIEVLGFGEDQIAAPFDNDFPEERFYNRTVIIDIIPKDGGTNK